MDNGRFDNLKFAASWFGACYFMLVFSALLLVYLSTSHVVTIKHTNFQLYAALPSTNIESTDQIITEDGRSVILRDFFEAKKSALAPMAEHFVVVADKYDLDYRLMPSIAMQESAGGKVLPNNSYNPFGYGVYGGKVLRFDSWEEGIETVGKGLRENYFNQGLDTPYEIMLKYTPPSLAKGGPWAIGVTHFMEELK